MSTRPLPAWQGRRLARRRQNRRLLAAVALTLAAHLAMLTWRSAGSPTAAPESLPALDVELVVLQPPPAQESLPPPPAPEVPIPWPEPEPPPPLDPPAGVKPEWPAPTEVPPTPVVTREAPPAEPATDSALVARLLAAPLVDEPNNPTEQLFGPAPVRPEPVAGFQVPERDNLATYLNRPLPELPFEDPELVSFMYAPGITGDLHRGFDAITPEFGWTTNTGLKVRCRWILVVVGCGWGR